MKEVDIKEHVLEVEKYIVECKKNITSAKNIVLNDLNRNTNSRKFRQILHEYLSDINVFIILNNEILNDNEIELTTAENSKFLSLNSELIILMSDIYFVIEQINNAIITEYIDVSEVVIKDTEKLKNEIECVEQSLSGFKEHLDDISFSAKETEKEILTHAISVMGILSAIIIIILGVVEVSTEWLKNSSQADFFMTLFFTLTIILFSIIVLLFVIYFLFSGNRNNYKTKGKSKEGWLIFLFILVIVFIFLITIGLIFHDKI